MSTNKNQSSIREARDQLFIDTADGTRLNTVTYNLGLTRPRSNITDDEWRTIGKKIALTSKQVLPPFRRILEVTAGPQYARADNLTVAAAATEEIITVDDASLFVQVGNLVLDKGLSTEESVGFCYTDTINNQIYLTGALVNSHSIIAGGSGTLLNSVSAGATSLEMVDSSGLPETYPYPILIGKGTLLEEVVIVTNNDTGTATLTVEEPAGASYSGTQYAHTGAVAGFVRRPLEDAAPLGRDFLQFDIGDTTEFPNTGWVFVDKGEVSEELLEFTDNDGDLHFLELKSPVAYATGHVVGASVTLAVLGETIEVASVLQEGTHWEINDASPRELKIIIPSFIADTLRLTDASFLHDVATTPEPSTTSSAIVAAGATEIPITSTTGFPAAGLMTIDSSETITYVLDSANSKLLLAYGLTSGYASGVTVEGLEVPYATTDLEEGNLRTALGVVQANQYPGPYVFDATQRSPSSISSTITAAIPFPTEVVNAQALGFSTLEVADASTWPASGYPIDVLVGEGTGAQETIQATERYTTTEVVATAINEVAGYTATSNPIDITVDDASTFPVTAVADKFGYRIIIDAGNPGEQTVTVLHNDGVTTLTVASLDKDVSDGVSVDTIADIIAFDALTAPHAVGETVTPLTEEIEIVDVTGFPTDGGIILINFGLEELSGGVFESQEYQDVDALKIVFDPAIALESGHIVGERVMLSQQLSTPVTDGTSYPFLIPPDMSAHIASLFDLVRAAGVKVTITTSR